MNYLNDDARPFFWPNSKREACFLIHGFTGSPAHMRYLAEYLYQEGGYTTRGVLLPGHGTKVEKMAKTGYQDWLRKVQEEYQQLAKKYKKVYVLGLSMGGVLALLLAEMYEVKKVVPISAPVKLQTKLVHLAPLLKYFKQYASWPQPQKTDKYDIGYEKMPIKCVPQLLKLMELMEEELSQVTCPLLIIQSYQDETVKPESAEIIKQKAASQQKQILWLEEAGHVCTVDAEKEKIHQQVLQFLQE